MRGVSQPGGLHSGQRSCIVNLFRAVWPRHSAFPCFPKRKFGDHSAYLLHWGPAGWVEADTVLSRCKLLPRSLTVPIRHGETGFVAIRFLPCVFQGIVYLATTVTLPQYKLCNNSLKSGLCVITPTVPENIKKGKKKWPWLSRCPSLHIKRQAFETSYSNRPEPRWALLRWCLHKRPKCFIYY